MSDVFDTTRQYLALALWGCANRGKWSEDKEDEHSAHLSRLWRIMLSEDHGDAYNDAMHGAREMYPYEAGPVQGDADGVG